MKTLGCFFVIFWGVGIPSYGQDISITLGPDEIALNQYFQITIEIRNDKLRNYGNFPEIDGFEKAGTSSSSSTNTVNCTVTSTQSVTQNYMASKEGIFNIPRFTMMINSKEIVVPEKKLKVGPPRQVAQKQYDPFSMDPFDILYGKDKPAEYIEPQDNAYLTLSTDKTSVYEGEGFTVSLALYVSDEDSRKLSWYNTSEQLADIVKEIKPKNCWEENFNIQNIDGKIQEVNNLKLTCYKIWEATFYPMNNVPVKFPSVGLKMIKYLETKNPATFYASRKKDFKTYYTTATTVKVKSLPPHPMRANVSVGNFKLTESISSESLETGNSFNYNFTIIGEGNISAIKEPTIKKSGDFDFYSPNTQRKIDKSNDHVGGSKTFAYYAIPNEPGIFNFGDYVQWVFFDPVAEKYDTLKSNLKLKITGESTKNDLIMSSDQGVFYDLIDTENNELHSNKKEPGIKTITNVLLTLMLIFSLLLIFKKQ